MRRLGRGRLLLISAATAVAATSIYVWLTAGPLPPLVMRAETPGQPGADAAQTLYLGSCLASPVWFGEGKILDAITDDAAKRASPAMLWLGDNLYYQSADLQSTATMDEAYRVQREHASLRRLLDAMPNYAIWDDHDFGPDNADRTFRLREASQQVFRTQWPNQHPVMQTGPVYTRIRRGDVELFLTDGRSFRDPARGGGAATAMLGQAQIAWLKTALKQSGAKLKVIVGGSQWLADHPVEEGWQHAPQERQDFLDWLVAERIPGVLFVSGDRHHSVLFERWHRDRIFTELSCSALTSDSDPIGTLGYERVRLLAGTTQNNFCRLSVSPDGRLTIAVLAADSETLFEQPVHVP